MPGHHWFRKWLGVRSAPRHYLEQYRSSETIGLRPKDILILNKTKQTLYQVQSIWKQTRIQILHRVCASHYLNKWWLDVSWRFPNSSQFLCYMCPPAPRVCSEPGGQKWVLPLSLGLIPSGNLVVQGPVSLRLMTSQFKDIVTHTQNMKTVKYTFCGVWVQNFVWNFKSALWNFTQNFEPMHRKIFILRGGKKWTTYDILELWHLKSYWDGPQ